MFVSCTKVEVIADPYWYSLVPDFQNSMVNLRVRSFFHGIRIFLTIPQLNEKGQPFMGPLDRRSDIYLLSPLLSRNVLNLAESHSESNFYYFKTAEVVEADNIAAVERNRNKAYYDTGIMLSDLMEQNATIPVIYDLENNIPGEDIKNFLDAVQKSSKNLTILELKIYPGSTEDEIRTFFNKELVKNEKNIVVFTYKLKNICFELSERDEKYIITSDSWFYKSYQSNILFSIEDDIIGMMNRVYYNDKSGKLTDIVLEGIISQ
jgi:hypothetical protein